MNENHGKRSKEIAEELRDMKAYQSQWRKVLRERFSQGNGQSWVRYLRNHYDYEKVFRDIKPNSSRVEIEKILEKRSV